MSRWQPIGGELPTLEEAKTHGVMWTRDRGGSKEMIHLPGYIVEKLGKIPAPELAYVIVVSKEMRRDA